MRSAGSRVIRSVVVAGTLLALLAGGSTEVGAQECLEMLPTQPFDTSFSCSSVPDIDRVFGTQIITWNGVPHLFANIGNEIEIWNVADPQSPAVVDQSCFAVGNQGDSDYDLMAFTVCDDCRWGAAWYKLGTVLFDLGTGPEPTFGESSVVYGATFTFGGLTFSRQGQQYLITASGVTLGSCAATSTLYRFEGASPEGLTELGCPMAADRGVLAAGGHAIDDVLYIGDATTRVYLFRIQDTLPLSLTYLSTPMRSYFGKDQGLAVDPIAMVAVETGNSGASLWDLSDPAAPVERSLIAGNFSQASVAYPLAFVSLRGVKFTERLFDISDIDNPVEIDAPFWSDIHPWNHPEHLCSSIQAGELSPDGGTLFLARYSRLQLADTLDCGLLPPRASVAIQPSAIFPGDTTAVGDVSTGRVDRRAIWVNTSAEPHATGVVAGSEVLLATTPDSLAFTVPVDVAAGVAFWAHVAVESDGFPYRPDGSTPGQVATAQVLVDRFPGVVIEIEPEVALIGDTVTLTAAAEGNPSAPAGGTAIEWTITPPSLSPTQATGPTAILALDETGPWSIEVVAHYAHEAPGGAPYDAMTTLDIEISTVAAAFVVIPPHPITTELIRLDASPSRIAPGGTPSYEWEITGATTYHGCPSGPEAEVCAIRAGTLNGGNHTIRLTVTNTVNGDLSVREARLDVAESLRRSASCRGDILFSDGFESGGTTVWNWTGP